MARLYAVEAQLPAAKETIRDLVQSLVPDERSGDFAQAMMDLGATICTPKRPNCPLCPWNDRCEANRRGAQETFPRRTPKVEGALRRGAAFVVLRADGTILLRSRPPRGLLGGMTEVPTTEWSADFNRRGGLASAPKLSTITAPVLWINSADDFINPPELGIPEKLVTQMPHAKFILIPISDATRGHGTHTAAAVWKQYLIDFLAQTEKK